MKVLVTGGAGFIGSHTVDRLIEDGHEVFVIDNDFDAKRKNCNEEAIYYSFDICDEGFVDCIFDDARPDVVIHLAAQTRVDNSIENPLEDTKTNLVGLINILESCRKYNVKKIVFSSSAAIYGDQTRFPILEEQSAISQDSLLSPYAISKMTSEKYIKLYKQIHDLDYTIFRFSNVFGPRQDTSMEHGGVISIFCNQIAIDQIPIIQGDGEQTRDFIFVKDVARALSYSVNSKDYSNKIFNLSTEKETSILEIFNALLPDVLPEFDESRKGDIKRSVLSNSKILQKTSWRPSSNFKDQLQETLRYVINQYSPKSTEV